MDPLYMDIGRCRDGPCVARAVVDLLALLNNMASVPVDLMPVVSFDDDVTSRAAAGTVAILGKAGMRVPMQLVRQNPAVLSGLVETWALT